MKLYEVGASVIAVISLFMTIGTAEWKQHKKDARWAAQWEAQHPKPVQSVDIKPSPSPSPVPSPSGKPVADRAQETAEKLLDGMIKGLQDIKRKNDLEKKQKVSQPSTGAK